MSHNSYSRLYKRFQKEDDESEMRHIQRIANPSEVICLRIPAELTKKTDGLLGFDQSSQEALQYEKLFQAVVYAFSKACEIAKKIIMICKTFRNKTS